MKVSGLDVHKNSIFCAIYDGKEYLPVNEYDSTIPKICQMGEYLYCVRSTWYLRSQTLHTIYSFSRMMLTDAGIRRRKKKF